MIGFGGVNTAATMNTPSELLGWLQWVAGKINLNFPLHSVVLSAEQNPLRMG